VTAGAAGGSPAFDLVPYAHSSGLRLAVPARWELSEDARPGVLLVAVAPEPAARFGQQRPDASGTGFRANLVVTCEELPAGLDLAAWQAVTAQMLPSALDEYASVSVDTGRIDGMPVVHRVAHHRSKAGTNVTMDQWAAVVPGPDTALGWSLTATVATRVHPHRVALLSRVAASWRPPRHDTAD